MISSRQPQTEKVLDERVERVIGFILHSLHEPLDYARMARLANLSSSQPFRLFKRDVGVSLQRFVELERMKYAKRLLAINRLSIKEVAAQVVFDNPFYFSRRFAKVVGVAPTEFRQELLNDPERPLHPYSYFMGLITVNNTYGSAP